MLSKRANRLALLIFTGLLLWALVSLACNTTASAPPRRTAVPANTQAPIGGIEPESEAAQPTPFAPETPLATPAPAILEARRLTLEWPATIRSGDSDVVRLTFEVDEEGDLQVTAEFAGHETRSEIVEIPDLYDSHDVYAEARLEMAGVEVAPNDLASQPLLRGRTVSFYWSIHPNAVGIYRGAVWFYLRYVPLDGGLPLQRPVTVQSLEIRTVDLLGLSGTPARLLGGLGALVGSVLGLDGVLSWLWKKFKKRDS